jgi:hypothetical protein
LSMKNCGARTPTKKFNNADRTVRQGLGTARLQAFATAAGALRGARERARDAAAFREELFIS